jgi:hypothetical protein
MKQDVRGKRAICPCNAAKRNGACGLSLLSDRGIVHARSAIHDAKGVNSCFFGTIHDGAAVNSLIREKRSAFLRLLLIRSLRDHLPHIRGKAFGCVCML